MVSANWLLSHTVQHESRLEKHCIQLLLLAPGLIDLWYQPMRLHVNLPGRNTYVPDLVAQFATGRREVVEVKAAKYIAKDVELFRRASVMLEEREMRFFVCSDKELRPTRVRFLEHCNYAAKRHAAPAEVEALVHEVRRLGRLRISSAMELPVSLDVIAHAVGRRLVTAGPTVDLSPQGWLTSMESLNEDLSAGAWLGCAPWHALMEI